LKIAIDFDGTIVKHRFPEIGEEVPHAFLWMHRFIEQGADLILYTMRSDGQRYGDVLTQAVDFCAEHDIHFFGVNDNPDQSKWTSSPKVYAKIYIDDAAFGCPLVDDPPYRPYVDWTKVGPAVYRRFFES
jgi:hypothetical protein